MSTLRVLLPSLARDWIIRRSRNKKRRTDLTPTSRRGASHLVYSTVGCFHNAALGKVTWITVTTWNAHEARATVAPSQCSWEEGGMRRSRGVFLDAIHICDSLSDMAESRSQSCLQPNDAAVNEAHFYDTLFSVSTECSLRAFTMCSVWQPLLGKIWRWGKLLSIPFL